VNEISGGVQFRFRTAHNAVLNVILALIFTYFRTNSISEPNDSSCSAPSQMILLANSVGTQKLKTVTN
jgi:hypothetical protein